MEKSDWVLFSEFELVETNLHHHKCGTTIVIKRFPMSLSTFIKYATEHKKNDCKRFQGLSSKVTIYEGSE